MNKKTLMITVIIAVVLIAIGVLWTQRSGAPQPTTNNDNTTDTQPPTTDNPSDSTATNPSEQVAATISYTDNGFTPQQVTVKSGDTIMIKNDSDNALSFNSDDHPTHTKEGELNVGNVDPGQSKTFVVTEKGTWGFHNHENASDTGSITVQ